MEIDNPTGKVLINCFRGRSRSVTIAIMYIRQHLGMPVPMALKIARSINPNDGFLAQLLSMEHCLNPTPQCREAAPKEAPLE
ncbi:LOW QUALITY PROTEIN: Dual specificity protein phosphatase 1 [Frankliniella fusca]|uniref:protein-tyrosine-phosphatase n=1 Tax=Frankliniella fusca TaxID=407009 RepID=A0AAE1HG25_9NEOP|nr:LOW QUALITY PROTEIN: Dual specificity protein phosphatase 1 [Frankliniella fusca]